jgi:hypothetical protein
MFIPSGRIAIRGAIIPRCITGHVYLSLVPTWKSLKQCEKAVALLESPQPALPGYGRKGTTFSQCMILHLPFSSLFGSFSFLMRCPSLLTRHFPAFPTDSHLKCSSRTSPLIYDTRIRTKIELAIFVITK